MSILLFLKFSSIIFTMFLFNFKEIKASNLKLKHQIKESCHLLMLSKMFFFPMMTSQRIYATNLNQTNRLYGRVRPTHQIPSSINSDEPMGAEGLQSWEWGGQSRVRGGIRFSSRSFPWNAHRKACRGGDSTSRSYTNTPHTYGPQMSSTVRSIRSVSANACAALSTTSGPQARTRRPSAARLQLAHGQRDQVAGHGHRLPEPEHHTLTIQGPAGTAGTPCRASALRAYRAAVPASGSESPRALGTQVRMASVRVRRL